MIARIRTANDAEMVIPTLWDMGLPIKACYFPVVRLIPASDRSKNKRAALPQPFDFLGGQSRNRTKDTRIFRAKFAESNKLQNVLKNSIKQ